MKKEIPSLPGFFADTDGLIYGPRGIRCPEIIHDGHLRIGISPSRGTKKSVHRLILETFVGPCPPGKVCRHLDGNPRNNHLDNLCWGTRSENQQDSIKHGTFPRGSKNGRAKLKEEQVKSILRLASEGFAQRVIAKVFGVSQRLVWNIIHRQAWPHIVADIV